MKEQLQTKLVEIISQIQVAVGKASDFAMDQIPDIAYQYIKFKTVWYISEMFIAVVILVGAIYCFKYFKRLYLEADCWDNSGYGMSVCTSIAVGFLATGTIVCNIHELLMIYIAPKVWLITQLANLVGGK